MSINSTFSSVEIYKPKVFDFSTVGQLYTFLEEDVTNRIWETNGLEGIVRLAISGGRSLAPILKKLANNYSIPWEKIELFGIDERYVDKNDKLSNQKIILEALGEDVISRIDELNFFRTDLPVEQSVKEFQKKLDSLDGTLFDLLILGVGEDGHIASLFPSGEYLSHQENFVISTKAPDYIAVQQRLSFTIETILNSREIFLVINGENKNQVLNELLEGNKRASEFPVKFLLAHPNLKIYHSFDFETEV